MITTQQNQDMRDIQWVLGTKNGMAASGTLIHDPADNALKHDLYKIVSLSLLFFEAIVTPFDRMIEEEDRFLDGLDLG